MSANHPTSKLPLIDEHGRQIRKLRVSLTDRCNLRCHYCMPVDSEFMREDQYLTPVEYEGIVRALCDRGLEEVRLTGGEPLMRKSFPQIVERLASLPLKKIALTTNGILLDRHFETLVRFGVKHLNISLDSLDAENFARITHGNHLSRVLANIERAKTLGFEVKINAVAMRGVNDHEIQNFIEWGARNDIEVRFLELMRIGHALENQKSQFISAAEIIEIVRKRFELRNIIRPTDSTSFNYFTSLGSEIGFIASESKAFCGACSRWRLSSDGILRACLLKDDGISLRNAAPEARDEIFNQVLKLKPAMRPAEVAHAMNRIGG